MRIADLPFAYCTHAIRILHTYHSHIAGCPLACFLFFLAYFLIPFIRCCRAVLLIFLVWGSKLSASASNGKKNLLSHYD